MSAPSHDTGPSPGFAECLRGKRIFITGATGFLGRVLVEKLLWSAPHIGKLVLLVRAGDERAAAARLRADVLDAELMGRLRARHGEAWESFTAGRVEAVHGDLERDAFGLDPERYGALCAGIDLVVASAASVTFDEQLDRALELNARGAGRTLQLARDAGDVPLLHVSTCFVSGRRQGAAPEQVDGPPRMPPGGFELDAVLSELDAVCRASRAAHANPAARLVAAGAEHAARFGFHDVYTFTKWLGEQLLARGQGAVPITILRPAIVESTLQQPMPGWIDAVRVADPLLVAYGRGRARLFPGSAGAVLDLIPADHVVHALIAALAELAHAAKPAASAPRLRVYQVGSSRNPIATGALLEHARQGLLQSPFRDENDRPVAPAPARFIPPELLRARLLSKRRRVRWLARVARATRWGPALGGAERALDHFLRLIDVYGPYLDHGAHHSDEQTRGLWNRLAEPDRARIPFDVTAIDWADYIAKVHVPGLQRYALHAESGAPLPGPAGELARGQRAGPYACDDAANLYQLFEAAARRNPSAAAFQVCRGGRWLRYTYEEALTTIRNIDWRLRTAYGIARGDRVVLVSSGCPEWVLTTLAVLRLGAVTVPLDPQWPAAEIVEAAAMTGAKLICAAPQLREGLTGAACPTVALAAPFVPAPQVGLLPGADVAPAPAQGDDLASIIFTSGTTVAPKGVMLTHENFLSNVRALMPLMRSSHERLLSMLPVHHVFETTMGHWYPLACGSTISYVTEIKPAEIMWMLRTTRPTMLVAVPRLIELLYNGVRQKVAAGGPLLRGYFRVASALSGWTGGRLGRLLFAKVHASFGGSLRRIVSGGSALEPSLAQAYRLFGIRVSEGYGLTETSPVLTVNPWDAVRFGSAGKVLPGVDLELRPVEGAQPGSGAVWVRGPNVTPGYYHNPEATAAALQDGWFDTGDIGRFDADGYLYLLGRTKDVIVSDAGKNVYPEEVELRYRGISGVKELVVLGLPGSGRGERVCAVVVPEAHPSEADIERIRAAIAERSLAVPSYQQVTQVEIWAGDLPKTSTLKVTRGKLRSALVAGRRGAGRTGAPAPAAASGAPRPGTVEAQVIEALARLTRVRPDAVQASQRLNELGLDSLSKVELVGELEARFGFRVDEAAVGNLRSVQDLIDLAVPAERPLSR